MCFIKLEVVPPLYERTFFHRNSVRSELGGKNIFYTGDREGFKNDMKVSDDVSVAKMVTVVEDDSDSSDVTESVKELSAELLSAAMFN